MRAGRLGQVRAAHAVARRASADTVHVVSLDAGDDDPVRFWSYVVAAIRTVVPGFGGAVLAALPNAGPSMVEVVLPRLINELALLQTPVVLVLDDYRLLGDELLHASSSTSCATCRGRCGSRSQPAPTRRCRSHVSGRPASSSRSVCRSCGSPTPRPTSCSTARSSSALHEQLDRFVRKAERGDRTDHDAAGSPVGAMNASPHGRFPNAPRARRSPSSAIAVRAQLDVEVGAEWACDVRVARLGEQLGDGAAAASGRLDVAAHQAGEHVERDAGHRRSARSALAGGVAGVVCDIDGMHGAMNTSHAASAAATSAEGSVPRAGSGGAMTSAASAVRASSSARPTSTVSGSRSRARAHPLDGETAVDHGPHGPRQVGAHRLDAHGRAPAITRARARSSRSMSLSVVCRCGAIRNEAARIGA